MARLRALPAPYRPRRDSLERALAQEELVLHYHPIVELASGCIAGAEGLVRWDHRERGLLRPAQFLPEFERKDLISGLTLWVLEEALQEYRRLKGRGIGLTVQVNLATRDLLDRRLPSRVERLLEKWQVPPRSLGLEITESGILHDAARGCATVKALGQMGVSVSIDDFGVGYSSLARLQRLPIHEVKIDRSFIAPLESDSNSRKIVKATIDLAHALGATVVAEGVEEVRTRDQLRELGCDLYQGHCLTRPLPSRRFHEWLGGREVRRNGAAGRRGRRMVSRAAAGRSARRSA